ncbi:MAG: hypothetical protein WAT79_15985 [Saprospiraceae bacterium]
MILEHNFACDLLENIEDELNLYGRDIGIKVNNISITKMNPNFEWLTTVQNFSLPIFTTGATRIIQISKEYYEILTSNWAKDHPKLVINGLTETIESLMHDDPKDAIFTAITDKISNLIYEYDRVLAATKETNHLFGIEDEEKILLIHLKRYSDILNSDTAQIDFLKGITLSKKISDLVLEIYIRFINMRLSLLNPETTKVEIKRNQALPKIPWKGEQKDLLELFVELQSKGWIEEFKYGEIKKTSDSIGNLIDLTLTKKGERSDPENSFYQILKGVQNPKTIKREYGEILKSEKERKCSNIKENVC